MIGLDWFGFGFGSRVENGRVCLRSVEWETKQTENEEGK